MIKPLFEATQVALSPAFTGSIVRKQWLKTPHRWLNLSAILNQDPKDIFKRNITITYEEYESKMKKYTKEKILNDLLIYISSL